MNWKRCGRTLSWPFCKVLFHRRGRDFFSSPPRPDRLSGPPSLPVNMYRVLFPRKWNGRVVNLTTHLHLVLRRQAIFTGLVHSKRT